VKDLPLSVYGLPIGMQASFCRFTSAEEQYSEFDTVCGIFSCVAQEKPDITSKHRISVLRIDFPA
jgi:hypothetical protein